MTTLNPEPTSSGSDVVVVDLNAYRTASLYDGDLKGGAGAGGGIEDDAAYWGNQADELVKEVDRLLWRVGECLAAEISVEHVGASSM